jgi:cysteine synthase A
MPTANDNSESIGRTPLVRINRLSKGLKCTILANVDARSGH